MGKVIEIIDEIDLLGKKSIDINLDLSLDDLRILSKFIEGEVLIDFEGENMSSEENLLEYYEALKRSLNELSKGMYRGLIDLERDIVDTLKEKGLEREVIVDLISGDEYDKDRIENIYTAMDEVGNEEVEAAKIYDNLDIYAKSILSKLSEKTSGIFYMPLIYKFFSFLYESTDTTGEIVITENAIEDLFNLDEDGVEELLTLFKTVNISIANKKGPILKDYTYLNDSTIKLVYNIFTVNPIKYMRTDGKFRLTPEKKVDAWLVE